LKDDLSRLKSESMKLEQRIRESYTHEREAEERAKYIQQKLKEVELERDLILAERNNALESNDLSSQQIYVELNSLRECFARLKVERDELLREMDDLREKEKEARREA